MGKNLWSYDKKPENIEFWAVAQPLKNVWSKNLVVCLCTRIHLFVKKMWQTSKYWLSYVLKTPKISNFSLGSIKKVFLSWSSQREISFYKGKPSLTVNNMKSVGVGLLRSVDSPITFPTEYWVTTGDSNGWGHSWL